MSATRGNILPHFLTIGDVAIYDHPAESRDLAESGNHPPQVRTALQFFLAYTHTRHSESPTTEPPPPTDRMSSASSRTRGAWQIKMAWWNPPRSMARRSMRTYSLALAASGRPPFRLGTEFRNERLHPAASCRWRCPSYDATAAKSYLARTFLAGSLTPTCRCVSCGVLESTRSMTRCPDVLAA